MTDEKNDKPEKAEEGEDKPVRVQFGKNATAETILKGINMAQDNWALRHPEKAHELYPNVFDEYGKRIRPD